MTDIRPMPCLIYFLKYIGDWKKWRRLSAGLRGRDGRSWQSGTRLASCFWGGSHHYSSKPAEDSQAGSPSSTCSLETSGFRRRKILVLAIILHIYSGVASLTEVKYDLYTL